MPSQFDIHIMPMAQQMYRYAYAILKHKEQAKDVVQECLLKIWDKKDLLHQIDNPKGWAMRITRNHCLDWVKTNRYQLSSITDDQLNQYYDPQYLQYEERSVWLNKILQKLPRKQAEVFHLREIEGFTYQEIADTLDISIQEVKVVLHRTRQNVRENMQKIDSYGIAN